MNTKKSQEHLMNHFKRKIGSCSICKKNYFLEEDIRTMLANEGNLKNFLLTYSHPSGIYKNQNSGDYWDKKFTNDEYYKDQDSMTKEKIDTILKFLPNRKLKLLDIGIGQGYLEQRLKELGTKHHLYGFDFSEVAIQRARRNYNGNFFQADLLKKNTLYKRGFYDAIVAIEVIEHIPPSKIFKFYETVNYSLKKGGVFIISTPLNEGLKFGVENPSAHLREYTIPILEKEFKFSGFMIENVYTLYAFKTNYRFKKLVSKIFKHWLPNNVIIAARKL